MVLFVLTVLDPCLAKCVKSAAAAVQVPNLNQTDQVPIPIVFRRQIPIKNLLFGNPLFFPTTFDEKGSSMIEMDHICPSL